MLTDIGLGIEYQGSRYKGSVLGKQHMILQHMILVSGDVTIHSAMLLQLAPVLAATAEITTLEMAELCAGFLREYRMKEASRLFLWPLNLDENSFLARQRTMEP
jgi:hypothetical protein